MSDSPSTAAVQACEHGNVEVLGGLVSSGAIDPDGADPASGRRYLVVAAQHGQTTCVRGLLQSNASPDTHDSQGDTPVCVAACSGHAGVLDVLLEHGANPNVTKNGEAALYWAAYKGSTACCRMLLAASADIAARHADGTALETATRRGHESCAALLTAAAAAVSGLSAAPVTLTFENRSQWPLVLWYLLPTPRPLPVGQAYTRPPEHRTVRLLPGTNQVGSTYEGHEWYLRAESDATLLDTYMVRSHGGAQQQHCVFPSLDWEWEDGPRESGQWRQYDPELLLRLLHAHASGHSMLTVHDPQRGVDYEINLTDRTQRNTRTGFVRRLRAVPPPPPSAAVLVVGGAPLTQLRAFPGDSYAPPPYWSLPGSQDGAGSSSGSPPVLQRTLSGGLQCELRPESPIFQEVLQMLGETTDLASLRLSAIYCVENPNFFREYQARRTSMLSRLGLPRLNERWLWHGTDKDSIPPILANGFLRDFNTRGAYGKGVYFARKAAYSLSPTYSKIDPNTGEHYLLLCRVLMGEACVGSPGMERPNRKPNSSSSALHESMVDRLPAEQSDIVVLSAGSDKQAYPEFVLKFQSRHEGGAFGGGRRGGGLLSWGNVFGGGSGGNGGGGGGCCGGPGGGPGGSVFGNGGPGSALGFTFGPSAVPAAGAHAVFGAAAPFATAAPAAPAFGGFANAPAALAEWEGSKGIALQDEVRSKTHAKPQSRQATMLVGQVVRVHFVVWERAELVLRELASASQTGSEGERAVCATIATQVIDTCTTMVERQPGMAYALSGFVLHVGERCPVLWECLLARLQASCCYCVPYYPENTTGNTDEFKKRLGYKQGETKKDFYARMAGYVTLYAALLQQSSIAQFPPHSAGNAHFDWTRPDAKMQTRPVQGGFAPKGVSPMARAWAWLARMLNHQPGSITATILLAFLKPCAHALSRAYPTQFSKLLSFLQTTYLAKIRGMVAGQGNPAEEEVARVSLESWLKDTNDLLAKGGCVPEPKEADMTEYKPPDDLSAVKGARGGEGGDL